MGDPPAGWTVAPWPEDAAAAPDRDRVEFVVPNWEIARDLDGLPGLKVVQTRSAGVDWIVDRVPAGVTLCSARGSRDPAMAEWVLWAILADYKAAGSSGNGATVQPSGAGPIASWPEPFSTQAIKRREGPGAGRGAAAR